MSGRTKWVHVCSTKVRRVNVRAADDQVIDILLGGKEVNDSDGFWDDHDPHHGEPEDLEDEPGYDEGFQWSCCQEPIGAEGCVRSRHLPKDAHKKKSRVDVASLTD